MMKRVNYRYNVTPFGLKNTSTTYHRMMNTFLEKEISEALKAYMDDVVLKSTKDEQHDEHPANVFRRVR